jgi:thioesterase DpgC
MMARMEANEVRALLGRAALPLEASAAWLDAWPDITGAYHQDAAAFSHFWRLGGDFLAALPAKPARTSPQAEAAAAILEIGRASRDRFLAVHVDAVYRALTRNHADHVRVDHLVYKAAEILPGLTPTRAEVAAEGARLQRDKDGIEIDQGIVLARVLAHPASGAHLCHAMLLPTPGALELLPKFRADGRLDLGAARIERHGKAAIVTVSNPRFLNAEDESSIGPLEIAIDLAILDPESEIAVLRGGVVEHPKYRGRPVFSTGINLTHLYHGKISYLWYLQRDLGLVNKLYRGLALPGPVPDDISGFTREKPWIAAVDAFAIGGGCQILLVMDYVVAASDAYLTLPARKEGIIPGAANLRLSRFTGERIARQLIMTGRRLECDSPEGRLICDEITSAETMEATLARVIDTFTGSGVVSAAGNRRAFRIGEEPLDAFRRYMAVYAREQASCHFSPALIANLERHWTAQKRKP